MIYKTNRERENAINAIEYHIYMMQETNEAPEYEDLKELAALLRKFRRAIADEMEGAKAKHDLQD